MLRDIICERCRAAVQVKAYNARFCSPSCRLEATRDKRLEQMRARYRSDRKKHNEQARLYAERNREKIAAYQAEYRKNYAKTERGKEVNKLKDHRRRSAVLNADQGCWYAREDYVKLLKNDPCSYCGSFGLNEIEHIDPISISLNDSWNNLSSACRSCNASKHSKDLLGFMLSRL